MTIGRSILPFFLLVSAYRDTLTLRNGTTVTGTWMGINTEEIRFHVDGETKTYPRTSVAKVSFGPASPRKPEPGMTIAQVKAILGEPQGIEDLLAGSSAKAET